MGGAISFQPTEFVKIALIVMLAAMIAQMGKNINEMERRGAGNALTTLPIAGIVAANNLSSGIIIAGIAFVMLFVACKKKWPFFACGFGRRGGAGICRAHCDGPGEASDLLKEYQLSRIFVWLEPETYPPDRRLIRCFRDYMPSVPVDWWGEA